jgi:transcription-repair coupling factor (superfamily II helicase)
MNVVESVPVSGPSQKTIFGAPEGQDARILIDRARTAMAEDRVVVHVALDDARMANLQDLIAFFGPDVRVVLFPAWDCLPYDRVSPNNDIIARRVAALSTLMLWSRQRERHPRILITTVNAITQRITPRDIFARARMRVAEKARVDVAQLLDFLNHNGYMRTDTVREAGEFAQRGGIIDIFPTGSDNPLRIDLFGDEVESIRVFDPATQRTQDRVGEFELGAVREFTLDADSITRFRAAYREQFGVARDDDPLYAAVSAGRHYNGMDHWLPLFFERMETLHDYAPNAVLSFDAQVTHAAQERFKQIADF